MLALTTAEITHGGPRRTTTRTSQWYVLSVRVRVRSGGRGPGEALHDRTCDLYRVGPRLQPAALPRRSPAARGRPVPATRRS